jgi:hypothetical protein
MEVRLIKRRFFVACGCAVGCGMRPFNTVAAESYPPFCASIQSGQISLEDTTNSTGRADLDAAIIFETKRIRSFFSVHPGVRILDDRQSPNAFAVHDRLLRNTDGTVLLGSNLIRSELISNNLGGIAVGGIIAHECAHILQFNTDLYDTLMASQSTARCLELHADFMAGFYFGVRAASKDLDVKPFAKSLFSKGDWAFNEPNHHGTPQEREDAMYAGFDLGKTSDATLVQAAAQGVRHVKSQ